MANQPQGTNKSGLAATDDKKQGEIANTGANRDKQKSGNQHKLSGGGEGEQYSEGTHSNQNDTKNNQGRQEKNDEIERNRSR